MMRGRWHVGFMVMLAMSSTGGILRDPLHEATRQGKEWYDRAQYPQALEAFGRGRAEDPDHPVLAFNIGDALLAMGKTQEARIEYRKALTTSDRRLKARAMYNLGNTHAAENDWPAAAAAFRESLILEPAQEDAKRNLELTIRKIKEQEETQRQQRDQQQDQSSQQAAGESGESRQNRRDGKNERQPSNQSEQRTMQTMMEVTIQLVTASLTVKQSRIPDREKTSMNSGPPVRRLEAKTGRRRFP